MRRLLHTLTIVIILFSIAAPAGAVEKAPPVEVAKPDLNINIPNLSFSTVKVEDGEGGKKIIDVPWISEYVGAVYRFAVPFGASLAVIMMMIGGAFWLTARGNAPQVDKAKTFISHAFIGLLLLVGSYLFLWSINPDLTKFSALQIDVIDRDELEYRETADAEGPLIFTPQSFADVGIVCPLGGGADVLPGIIDSTVGKVTYRFGGKGGNPPYSEKNPELYTKYNNNCPEGTKCLDCSGYVNSMLRCAGMRAPGGGTINMFNKAEKVTSIDKKGNAINGVPLQIGDLIGWMKGDPGHEFGHVIMYVGGGRVVESSGGKSGREPGKGVRISTFAQLGAKYSFTRIIRASGKRAPASSSAAATLTALICCEMPGGVTLPTESAAACTDLAGTPSSSSC
jgi:hypothetical protein